MKDDAFSHSNDFNISNKSLSNPYFGKHYLCNQCLKFPYIKFSRDRKHIRLTCSCLNNKKILIRDLFEINYLYLNKRINFISLTNLRNNNNEDIENELICKKHKQKFKGFSKIFNDNYCQFCINNKRDDDIIISFDDIKIEVNKIEQLLKIINNNKLYEESEESDNINDTYNFIETKNDFYGLLSTEEEKKKFTELVNIIINDYKNYPNFSHFFNNCSNFISSILISSKYNFISNFILMFIFTIMTIIFQINF